MTNEQAKQEAIKKAWGNSYELIIKDLEAYNDDISTWAIFNFLENGIAFENFLHHKTIQSFKKKPYTVLNGNVILDEIADLKNNNGWKRIEPDGSNLPEKGEYRWLFESGSASNFYYEPGDIMSVKLTHYKPITPEELPIY